MASQPLHPPPKKKGVDRMLLTPQLPENYKLQQNYNEMGGSKWLICNCSSFALLAFQLGLFFYLTIT